MNIFQQMVYGFGIALQPMNLLFAFLGAVAGTMVGVLPGLGPTAALSMLLPVTFGISPTGAMIMLAGIYYGAQYGGSTTSILVNIPGEAASVTVSGDQDLAIRAERDRGHAANAEAGVGQDGGWSRARRAPVCEDDRRRDDGYRRCQAGHDEDAARAPLRLAAVWATSQRAVAPRVLAGH